MVGIAGAVVVGLSVGIAGVVGIGWSVGIGAAMAAWLLLVQSRLAGAGCAAVVGWLVGLKQL